VNSRFTGHNPLVILWLAATLEASFKEEDAGQTPGNAADDLEQPDSETDPTKL